MSNLSLRRRGSFLSGLCLFMALVSGYVFLLVSFKFVEADWKAGKWLGFLVEAAVAEGMVEIDFERLQSLPDQVGAGPVPDADTDLSQYFVNEWIQPAARRGLLPVVIISFVQTLVFFFLAILFWFDRPPKAPREEAP
ncbi:MAG: hypothetical protein AAFV77_03720 [Planctomycetota bacterium]